MKIWPTVTLLVTYPKYISHLSANRTLILFLLAMGPQINFSSSLAVTANYVITFWPIGWRWKSLGRLILPE